MAMNVGGGDEEVIAGINTTPLVDVMLVLLIIFLITIPVVTQSIALNLPKERNVPTQTKPENILLAVAKDGSIWWNARRVADTTAPSARRQMTRGISSARRASTVSACTSWSQATTYQA